MNDDHGHTRLMHRMTISGLALGQERVVMGGLLKFRLRIAIGPAVRSTESNF